MKFKVDENLPEEVCSLLRQASHDAMSVVEQQLAGTPDSRLHEVCIEGVLVLLQCDNLGCSWSVSVHGKASAPAHAPYLHPCHTVIHKYENI